MRAAAALATVAPTRLICGGRTVWSLKLDRGIEAAYILGVIPDNLYGSEAQCLGNDGGKIKDVVVHISSVANNRPEHYCQR